MDWNEIISDLKKRLAASEEYTARLRRFLEDAQELAAAYGGTAPPTSLSGATESPADNGSAPTPSERRRWRKLTRAAAIKQVLREATGPMSPSQIRDRLHAHGREGDAPKYISAQLNHMQDRREVIRKGRGEWVLHDRDVPGDAGPGDLLEPRPVKVTPAAWGGGDA